jgi:hypothetical protein
MTSTLSPKALCQQATTKTYRDYSKKISLAEFEQRVDRATALLTAKPLLAIADSDQVNIIMCLNTIAMTREQPFSPQPRFKGERYDNLEMAKYRRDYERSMMKIYEYTPNRGAGIYFKKLDIELYGTPHLYSLFEVSR